MQAIRIRANASGQTTVEDFQAPFPAEGTRSTEATIPATAFWLTRTGGDELIMAPAPHRHLAVILSGRLHIAGGDGSSRSVGPGDLVLLDDAGSAGHEERTEGEVWKLLVSTPDWDPPSGKSEVPETEPRERSGRPLLSHMFDDGPRTRTEPFVWHRPLAPVPDVAEWPQSDAGAWLSRAVYAPTEGHEFSWHRGPRRQLAVTLAGGGENETGDGTKTQPHAGDFVFVDDTDGQGHISRGRGDRRILFVTVADNALTERLAETP